MDYLHIEAAGGSSSCWFHVNMWVKPLRSENIQADIQMTLSSRHWNQCQLQFHFEMDEGLDNSGAGRLEETRARTKLVKEKKILFRNILQMTKSSRLICASIIKSVTEKTEMKPFKQWNIFSLNFRGVLKSTLNGPTSHQSHLSKSLKETF